MFKKLIKTGTIDIDGHSYEVLLRPRVFLDT